MTPLENSGGIDPRGAGHHHPDQDRRRGGRHLAGADHHLDRGRYHPGGAGRAAQQVRKGQEHRPLPGAIRSQVIVELEKKVAAEIIDHYGEVTVKASADDPTVCLVEFGFAVAHGLNQSYLTVHITV